jgi:hypothetical protein
MTTTTHIEGLVAPGFEEVRAEFEHGFAASDAAIGSQVELRR